MHNFFKGVD